MNIAGGEVTGGAAVGTADVTALGGTIYSYGGGKNQTDNVGLKITGGTVGGGTANGDKGGSGGAIYINNTVASLSNCTINGGTATQKAIKETVNGEEKANTYGGLGGAIYLPSGTVNMGANTTISGGTAYRGGCLNVAVSLESVPGENFVEQSLYTEIKELKAKEFTGVLINEILKDGEENDRRGKMPIYANAYATFTVEGQPITILADAYNAGKTKGNFLPGHTYTAYSLSDVMNAIDLRWRTLDEAAKTSVMENLYNNYDNVMHSWGLQYMIGQVKNLKVLTIGNSLSVDAGHMLGYIAKIESMEKVRFSTLYYGGCTLRQHANFLTDNTPEYRWYDTDAASPDKKNLTEMTPGETVPYVISRLPKDQITMYEGIVVDKWDIIVLQQGVFESGKPESHEEDLDILIDYVRKHATNPNVVLMWNMIWAAPVESEMLDRSNNGIAPDASDFETSYDTITGMKVRDNKEAQDKMFALICNAVQTKVLTNDNFIDVIPAGTAQQNGLWSGLTDENLYRDYIHASALENPFTPKGISN